MNECVYGVSVCAHAYGLFFFSCCFSGGSGPRDFRTVVVWVFGVVGLIHWVPRAGRRGGRFPCVGVGLRG